AHPHPGPFDPGELGRSAERRNPPRRVARASDARCTRLVGSPYRSTRWRSRMRRIPCVFVLLLSLFTRPAFAAPPVLRVSAIPDEAPTELLRKFKPLGEYLSKKIGMEVKFVPVTDYAATVEGLAGKHLDLVWYGGFTFVQARLRTGNALPLVQREEDT